MSLQDELTSLATTMAASLPDVEKQSIMDAKDAFEQSFDRTAAIQPGQKLPEFTLSNAVGTEISSVSLLTTGPLLITFYRGSWCPFCNLALRSLQKHLPQIKSRGVTLVAITPELPDFSLSTTEKLSLDFHVLTDKDNKYASELGLLWRMPDALRPVYEGAGKDLRVHNGNNEFSVPVTATVLVDRDGVVRETFVEPDFMKRIEPEVVLGWIDGLEK
ncbi:redoxin domain-containing protein [Aspergillus heterothallicus]